MKPDEAVKTRDKRNQKPFVLNEVSPLEQEVAVSLDHGVRVHPVASLDHMFDLLNEILHP